MCETNHIKVRRRESKYIVRSSNPRTCFKVETCFDVELTFYHEKILKLGLEVNKG